MNRSKLVAVGVLVVCAAGFGMYFQHATAVQRQTDSDSADTADRLKGAILDLLASKEREAMLTEKLRAAADRERALVVADLADLRTQFERAKDDRDVYESMLQEMLESPGHRELLRSRLANPETRARGVRLELHRRHAALFRTVNETLPQLRGDLANAERSLTDIPSSHTHADYARRLWDLQAETERAARIADNLATFVEENQPNLLNAGSAAFDALSASLAARASLVKRLSDLKQCVAAHRTSTLTVHADEGWQSCDVTIADGEILAVWAWGKWYWRESSANPSGVGPEGETGSVANRIVEGVPNGALLLRIHGSNDVRTGWVSLRPVHPAGPVEFRINDQPVADNRGELVVTMWVFRPLRSE